MKEFIEALTIFMKYNDCDSPFSCEHDILYVTCIDPELVSKEDDKKLDELGFFVEDDVYVSYRYGSS